MVVIASLVSAHQGLGVLGSCAGIRSLELGVGPAFRVGGCVTACESFLDRVTQARLRASCGSQILRRRNMSDDIKIKIRTCIKIFGDDPKSALSM